MFPINSDMKKLLIVRLAYWVRNTEFVPKRAKLRTILKNGSSKPQTISFCSANSFIVVCLCLNVVPLFHHHLISILECWISVGFQWLHIRLHLKKLHHITMFSIHSTYRHSTISITLCFTFQRISISMHFSRIHLICFMEIFHCSNAFVFFVLRTIHVKIMILTAVNDCAYAKYQ